MKKFKILGSLFIAFALIACNKAGDPIAPPSQSQNVNSNKQANIGQQDQLLVATKTGAASYIIAFKTEYPYADGHKLTAQEAEAVNLNGVDKGLTEMKTALGTNLGLVETLSTSEAKVKVTLTSDEVEKVRSLSRVVWVSEAIVLPQPEKVGGIDNVPVNLAVDEKTTNFPITKDIPLTSSPDEKTSIMPLPDIKLDSQSGTTVIPSPTP